MKMLRVFLLLLLAALLSALVDVAFDLGIYPVYGVQTFHVQLLGVSVLFVMLLARWISNRRR